MSVRSERVSLVVRMRAGGPLHAAEYERQSGSYVEWVRPACHNVWHTADGVRSNGGDTFEYRMRDGVQCKQPACQAGFVHLDAG